MKKIVASCFILVCILTMTHPAIAELVKITDNVYSYLDVKNPDPANAFAANAGIIIGDKGIVVVDTLISAKTARGLMEDIRKISDKPISYVVNTHYHLDHVFGNSEFEKPGTIIVAHENNRASVEKNKEQALKYAKDMGLTDEDLEGTRMVLPALTFSEKMSIDIGKERVELIHPGPSHTAGSILVYLPAQKVLFAGDILFTDFHPFMGEGDIGGWLKVLDYMLELDVEKIIPGHGPLSGKKDLRDMRDYIAAFDRHAKAISAKSKDIKHIEAELLKVLPKRSRGQFLIPTNVQMKYMTK